MLPIPSRHRSLTLFAVAIAAQVLFLAIQIRRGQQVRLIRVWAIESVSPLGRGAAWSVDGTRGLWNNYVALRHMREERTPVALVFNDMVVADHEDDLFWRDRDGP